MEQFFIPTQCVQVLPGRKVAVLAPHPDDEVFGCGGSLALLAQDGASVHVAVLTDGQKWTSDTELNLLRRQESECAARVLGYPGPEFWALRDGELLNTPDLAQRIQTWVEALEADTLIAPSIWEMHRDHRACAQAACEAILALEGRVTLLMYEIGHPLTPNLLVDISPINERKQLAVGCFRSQLARQHFDAQLFGLNRYRTYTLPASVQAAEAFCRVDAPDLAVLLAGERPATQTVTLMQAQSQLDAARVQAQSQLDMAREHTEELERTIAEQALEMTRLEQRAGRFEDLAAQNARQIERLAAALANHEASIAHIFQTRSWRWTKPMRDLSAVSHKERPLSDVLACWLKGAYHRLLPETCRGKIRIWRCVRNCKR